MMDKHHIIYRTTNLLNNRYYIGMHSTENINDGYLGSGLRLAAEIKKYGKENFVREVLEHLPTREALKLREAEIVNVELLADKNCLNLKVGGEGGGGFKDAEHQRKCSSAGAVLGGLACKEKSLGWFSPENMSAAIARLSEHQCHSEHWIGRKHSEETKKKMSAIKQERKFQQGISNSQYGTCWITKDSVSQKIKLEQLASFIDSGWVRGRK